MSDLADKIRELPIKHSLDCLGYPDCDGDLVSEPHSEKCLEMSACVSREVVLGLVGDAVAEAVLKTFRKCEQRVDDAHSAQEVMLWLDNEIAAAERQMKRVSPQPAAEGDGDAQ